MAIPFCESRLRVPIERQVKGHDDGTIPVRAILVEINAVHVDDVNFVAAKRISDRVAKSTLRLAFRSLIENILWNRNGNDQTTAPRSCGGNNEGPMSLLDQHSIQLKQHLLGTTSGRYTHPCQRIRHTQDGQRHASTFVSGIASRAIAHHCLLVIFQFMHSYQSLPSCGGLVKSY